MIEVEITEAHRKLAKEKGKEMGKLKHSVMDGSGNITGFIGEILYAEFLGAKHSNTYDYDLIKGNETIDVKSKICAVEPKPEYECSVYAYNIKQKCDYYVFARIHEDYKKAWLLGGMKKSEFLKRAKLVKKGEVDPKSNFGWTFPADCYILEISQLNKR
jgi:hypothetical protein